MNESLNHPACDDFFYEIFNRRTSITFDTPEARNRWIQEFIYYFPGIIQIISKGNPCEVRIYYSVRLKQFQQMNWEDRGYPISSTKLSECGFYPLNDKDHCKCVACELVLSDWQSTDEPFELHWKLSNKCIFMVALKWLSSLNENGMSKIDRIYPTELHSAVNFINFVCKSMKEPIFNLVVSLGHSPDLLCLLIAKRYWQYTQQSNNQRYQTPGHLTKDAVDAEMQNTFMTRKADMWIPQNLSLLFNYIDQVSYQNNSLASAGNKASVDNNVRYPNFCVKNDTPQTNRIKVLGSEIKRNLEIDSNTPATNSYLKNQGLNFTKTKLFDYTSESTVYRDTKNVEPEMNRKLEVETKSLLLDFRCEFCSKKNKEIVLIPCGHMVACNDCGSGLFQCTICSTQVIKKLRVYMN